MSHARRWRPQAATEHAGRRCACGLDDLPVVRDGVVVRVQAASRKLHDITGRRFGKLVVVARDPEVIKDRASRWQCLCDCGAHTVVDRRQLIIGGTKSCGCAKTTHGMTGTLTYKTWGAMINRCENP